MARTFLPSHPAGIHSGKPRNSTSLHTFGVCLSGCPAPAVWQTCPAQVAPDGFLTPKGGRRNRGDRARLLRLGLVFPALAMLSSVFCHADLAPALVELPRLYSSSQLSKRIVTSSSSKSSSYLYQAGFLLSTGHVSK